MRICEIEGCDRKYKAQGFCMTHYIRAWRGTDIDAPLASPMDIVGERRNSWLILQEVEKDSHNSRRYLCRCDCGAESVCRQSDLVHDRSTQCKSCASTARKRRYCPVGHDTEVVGRVNHTCAQCNRDRALAAYRKDPRRQLDREQDPMRMSRRNRLDRQRRTERQLVALGVEGYA